MGQIIGGAAKPKRCNLSQLSQLGTPAAGEHILVSSDNSMNAAGQGNFDCYIMGDGTTAATALPLKSIASADLNGKKNAASCDAVNSGLNGRIAKSDVYTDNDRIESNIPYTTGGFYNYKSSMAWTSNNNFVGAMVEAQEGDMFSFSGRVAYSNCAGVVFCDAQNNIISYLYGDNTSTVVVADTGIIYAPAGTAKVYFNGYVGGGVYPVIKKYTYPKIATQKFVTDSLNVAVYNGGWDPTDWFNVKTQGYYYHYQTGVLTSINSTDIWCVELTSANGDFVAGQRISFRGRLRYGNLCAIQFWSATEQISFYGRSESGADIFVYTGEIEIPENCTRILIDAYTNGYYPEIVIYSLPKTLTTGDFGEIVNNTKFCVPYYYIFSQNTPDDIYANGMTSWETSGGGFLIHQKYFLSYRRIIEWRVKLGNDSVIAVGTNNNSANSIAISSRQTKVIIDIPNMKMDNYGEYSYARWTKSITSINTENPHIIRMTQYDQFQKIELIDENTLAVVAENSFLSSTGGTFLGKLIGYPFIQSTAGYLKVNKYSHSLVDKPTIVFIGDSITEVGYRTNTYAGMLIEKNFNNEGVIIAQGGATDDKLAYTLTSELPFMKPKYLSILSGTNVGITATQIARWKTFCEENGIIYIRHFVPVSENSTTYPWASKNTIIEDAGIIGARFDIATASGNNPSNGANTSLFMDEVHPNTRGQVEMYKRFLADVPIVQ